MMKRIFALLLCLLMTLPMLFGCANEAEEGEEEEVDKGAYIKMYLADQLYDLSPVYALTDKSAQKVVSLMYSGLFKLDKNGKVQKDLVDSYKISNDPNSGEYKMTITMKETFWSDGIPVDAADVIFAWKQILDVENSSTAASLLFPIKNAREVFEGDCSIDDLGVTDPDELVLEITFEEDPDYDAFIRNLTSIALVPLREDIVSRNDDWAKKPATIVCSGPFTLRAANYAAGEASLTLERNQYYFRDKEKDALDKSVTPYRLIVDYSLSAEEIKTKFDNGEIFYIGEIPVSVREYYKNDAVISDDMSTHTYYLNQKALIADGGEGTYLFADANVRKALSLAIDRDAIANALVFAKAATALVPYGVFETDSAKSLFREVGGNIIATTADVAAAKSLLSSAGIDASKYSFAISVRANSADDVLVAEAVQSAWNALGFNVSIDKVAAKVNDDKNKLTQEVATDIMDDIFAEKLHAGEFEVAAIDLLTVTPDAYSTLSIFAKSFSGQAIDMTTLNYELMPHISGYDSEAYNALMEEIYAEKDLAKRAEKLHAAEAMLLEDMPIIPIVFNQDAYVIRNDLSKFDSTYYGNRIFNKLKLKNYELYVETTAE